MVISYKGQSYSGSVVAHLAHCEHSRRSHNDFSSPMSRQLRSGIHSAAVRPHLDE